MDEIREFDTVEEMMAYMAKQEEEANARLHQRQRIISFGDYVLRPHESGLLIFGYVQEERERNKGEDQETIAMLNDSHERGFMTGIWYSVLCPEGEQGSAHRVTLWPIFKEEFDAAQAVGFDPRKMVPHQWFGDMIRRIEQERSKPAQGASADEDEVGFVAAQEDPEETT